MFRFLQKWHTKIGVYIALFVFLLVITGIALNHSQQLNLNKYFIQSELLLDFYQISPANEPIAFQSNGQWATQVGERLYFNESEIAKDVDTLVGLIKTDDMYVIAFDVQLALLTETGELVEKLSGVEGVPSGMQALGKDERGDVVIKASHGYYQVNLDDLEWNEYDELEANWSESSSIPDQLKTGLLKKYRGSGLSLERVLRDLHSGRIVGTWGIYAVDMIALLFLFLAITGLWMWWGRK